MSAILQLNGFRVLNEPKFAENGRCVLHLLSETESEGCALKFFVSTFDRERIERLKINFLMELQKDSEEKLNIAKKRNPDCKYANTFVKMECSEPVLTYVKEISPELPEKSDFKLFIKNIKN